MVWFDRTLAWSDGEPNPANASVVCFRVGEAEPAAVSDTSGVDLDANPALLSPLRWTEDCPDLGRRFT
jgi:hypothetical protein